MTSDNNTQSSRDRLDQLEQAISEQRKSIELCAPAARGSALAELLELEKARNEALYSHIRIVKAALDIE